jgi:hypothetical protein
MRVRDHGAPPLPACGERVGVRGPDRTAQTRGYAPSPGLLRNPTSPRAAGRGENRKSFSRRAFAPELCPPRSPDKRSAIRERSESLLSGPGFRLRSSGLQIKKGTERRQAHPTMAASSGCGSGLAKPARLSALRGGTCRNITSRLSLGPCLLRRGRNAHEGAFASTHSAVAAPHAPVVVPEGMMPKAARERGYKPRPQEPHSLHQSAVTGDAL